MKNSLSNSDPNSPRRSKQADATFMAVSIGLTALICIAITGVFFYVKFANDRKNSQSLAAVPTKETVTSIPSANYSPRFEAGDCPFQTPDSSNVSCGYVIVPESRSGNVNDTIQLAVAIYHSSNPAPDPILFLSGGPGGAALTWSVDVYSSVIAPLTANRDFVVFDPRGVGFSKPALECDEVKHTYLSDLQEKIPADQRTSYYEGALLTCKNTLTGLGANLSSYTSADMAADARDVLIALGYQQGDLYGISYGTRVAQFVMRSYPEVVRAVIMDSVVPVEVQLLDQDGTAQEQALQTLLADCSSDPACSASFPDLKSVYADVMSQLDAQPVELSAPIDQTTKFGRKIDGTIFHNILLWMLRAPETIRVIPQMIYQTHAGDYSILRLANALPVYAFDTISIGDYVAVNCHDQVYAMSVEKLDATLRDLCRVWEIKPPLSGENDPISSNIPSLIIAGKYDSTTPVSFANQLAGHLTVSHVVVIPNQGHSASSTGVSDCPVKLILDFLNAPQNAPDTTCVNQIPSANFAVPFNAQQSVAFVPASLDQYQITVNIPSGWTFADFGFFNRVSWYGDPTQIGVQRAKVSEKDWLIWLETNFAGSAGLDQVPVKIGEHKTNGLAWSIYQSDSNAMPVEIAFTKINGETLMVLMLSNKAEQSALHDLIFLPVIDSVVSTK